MIGSLGENLIFAISQPRAGSTLLQRILAGHRDVFATAEPWIMLHPLYALKERGLTTEYDAGHAREALKDFCESLDGGEDAYVQAVRGMGAALYNNALQLAGKRCFLDKTPRYYFVTEELRRTFPQAKFIVLLRNPLAVLASILDTWVKQDWSRLDVSKVDLVQAPALLARALDQFGNQAIIVRYEELVSEPERIVRGLCEYLELAYDPALLEYGNSAKPKGRMGDPVGIHRHSRPVGESLDKWKTTLASPRERLFAEAYLASLDDAVLTRLGYPKAGLLAALRSVPFGPGNVQPEWETHARNFFNLPRRISFAPTAAPQPAASITQPALARVLSPRAAEYVGEADRHFAARDFANARDWIERALDMDADHPDLLITLANLEVQLGNLDAAAATLKKVAALQPQNPVIHVLLARLHLRQENIEEFENSLGRALRINPEEPSALRLMADLNLETGRFQDAAKAYFSLLQKTPNDVELILPLGVCFYKAGDRDSAKMMFERVLELQPGHALARENLSAVLGTPLPPPLAPQTAGVVASVQNAPAKSDSINEAFLKRQREFWNVPSMEQAMFERVFTSDEILRMSREEKWAAWHRSAAESVAQILYGLPAGPEWSILEVGCGVGRVIKPLRERFARVDGVDISTQMIEFARQYLADAKGTGSVFLNNGADLSGLRNADYDLVYSMIVFQHIRSVSVVRSYLREIRRVLKPGGFFKLQVHERREGFGRFDEEADGGKQYGFQGNGYTHDELRELFREAGLEISSLETRGSWIWATTRRPVEVGAVNATPGPDDDAPLVSAIVSTYKSERFMRGCLEDLVGQTLFAQGRMEIIVVDSHSPENERAIIEEFQRRHPNIISIRTGERETVYAAWNRGIQRARGKYVTNANTDDRHRPDGLELLAQALERSPEVDLVYGDTLVTRSESATWDRPEAKGVFRWPEFDVRPLFDICCMGPHPMWRRSVHTQHGFFDPEYRSAGDYEFWLRLAVAGCRMKRIPEIVGIYLENDASVSLSDGSLSWRESEKARNQHWPAKWGRRPPTAWRSCEQPWPPTDAPAPSAKSNARVLLACDFFWPSVGGVELFVEDLALRLRSAGCEVDIACREIPERTASERHGIRIHQLATTDIHGFALTPAALQQLRALLVDGRFDAVVALSQPDNWLGESFSALKGVHPRVSFLPSINATNVEEWQTKESVGRVREILRSVDRVVAVTENGCDQQFLRDAGLEPAFIPHACERDAAPGNFRVTHGFEPVNPLLVMVANFWPVKNHLGLLQSLKDQPGDWQLAIIGHRIAHFGDYYSQVAALAKADPRIRILGGLPREQAAAAIRDADVLLVPSKGESAGPLVVLQAMSYGTPWISTPTCNATPDEAGGIVAPLERFSEVIQFLLARADLRSELGRLGQAHWEARFTWEKTLPAFLKLIEGRAELPDLRFPQELRAATNRIRGIAAQESGFATDLLGTSRIPLTPSLSPNGGEGASTSTGDILFSVIIPTYNRAGTLRKCLDAVRRQQFELNRIEVFICDDGSTDNTREVASQFQAPFPITYLHQKNSGPAAARNLGIRRARGRYLLILNDDAVLEPDAFRLHFECHQQRADEKIAVLGRFTFPKEFTSTPFGYALEHSELLFFYRKMKAGQTYDFNCFFTCNISLPRVALDEVGLFDERFDGPAAEDIELGYRLFERGYRVLYEPRCIAWHHHQMTPEGFCRTHQIRGQSAITLMIVQPDAPWYLRHDFARLNDTLEQLKKEGPSVDEVLRLVHKCNELPAGANTPEALEKRANEILPLLRFLQQYHELIGMLSSPRLPELIFIRQALRDRDVATDQRFRPAVSVVIPCYNYAHFLPEAVESVVAQTFRDFEIIIVNDGSTDNSADVARELIRKHDGRCRMSLLDTPNSGQPAASRNNGIRAARGRFILCLDADDKIEPTFLAKAVATIEQKDNIGVVYSHIRHFGERSDTYACGEFEVPVLAKDNVLPYCALYRRELWEAVGGYRLNVRGYEDWDFWLSLCERGWKGRLIPEPLFLYRKHGSGLLANANERRERLLATIVRNHPRVYNDRTRRWAEGILQQDAEQPTAGENTLAENMQHAPQNVTAVAPTVSTSVAPGKPRLRVTYLISNITGVTGGNQTLLRQADEMHRRGHEVTLVTYSPKPAWFKFQMRVIQVPVGKPMASSVPPSDVVVATYFTNTHELLRVNAPVKIYYAQGDQFIFADSTMADTEMNRRLRELSRASYLAAGVRFVPNSRNLASAVEKLCGRRADAILPVCTDQIIFRPLQRTASESGCRILIVGPDTRGTAAEPLTFKGIQDTYDALKILAQRGASFTAIRMSSTGPEIFADFPCEFHIAPDDDTKTILYGTADILIYASHYDSCPRPPQEAMAAGCAVVCTATPGAMEYCRDGGNALLVPVQSPQSIPDAVERLIKDSALRDKLIKGGLSTAAEHPREREWNEWESILYRFVDEARTAPANGAANRSKKKPGSVSVSNATPKRIELASCARLGHLAGARELLGKRKLVHAWNATLEALQIRPFHPEAWLLLSEIAEAAGDAKLAKSCADRVRKMAPGWGLAKKASKDKTAKAKVVKTVLPAPPDRIAALLADAVPAGPGGTGHRPVPGGNLPPSFVTAKPETKRVVPSAPNAAGEWPVPPALELDRPGTAATCRPSLTVCLIARNEEKFICPCLESIRGLAQQIVVVDTGSTDGTRSIAERAGAEVYSFEWCDDFSAARNAALERATGDWILFLDADEELLSDQRDNLLKLIADESAIAWRLPMIDKGREDEGVSYVPRLFRNAPGLFYVGRVHEQVFSSVEVRRAEWGLENKFGNATLLHHGYTKELVRSRDKIARNLRLLQVAVEELPGEPNLLMNLGLELVRDGRLHEGLQQYAEAFRALSALPKEQVTAELRESLITQYCTHLIGAKNYTEVAAVLQSPLVRSGGLTATLHWLFGLACIETKNFAEGAEQMRQCLAKRKQPAFSPINKNILKAGPGHCLAMCLAALKRTKEADAAFQSAIGEDPQFRPVRFDYARFLAGNGQEVEALKWLHQLMAEEPSDTRVWQFGGQVALSKPEFLEFACDWTGEAIKLHGNVAAIVEQRATALLLSGNVEQSFALWQKVGTPVSPNRAAALLVCQAALGRTLDAVGDRKVSMEFIAWYRRLLATRAAVVLDAVNERIEALRKVVPAAVETIEMAMAEASA
jgi:glycosyltransferase involved in cell wall biosynthesis/Tfp pilus assembly protein PilF/protein-L-isoaspartate O-methyltransferase